MLEDMAARHRHWFRFHLSTAVFFMLTAGLLLWVNTCVSEHATLHFTDIERLMPGQRSFFAGWPESCWMRTVSTDGTSVVQWLDFEFWLDVLVALAILASQVLLCEWWLRRSEMKCRGQRS